VAEPVAGPFCSGQRTCAETVALPLPFYGLQWRWLALPLNFSEPPTLSQNSEFSLLPINNIFVIISYGLFDPLLQ
jgi:hypothetical protein